MRRPRRGQADEAVRVRSCSVTCLHGPPACLRPLENFARLTDERRLHIPCCFTPCLIYVDDPVGRLRLGDDPRVAHQVRAARFFSEPHFSKRRRGTRRRKGLAPDGRRVRLRRRWRKKEMIAPIDLRHRDCRRFVPGTEIVETHRPLFPSPESRPPADLSSGRLRAWLGVVRGERTQEPTDHTSVPGAGPGLCGPQWTV